jgi:hypothetical protein
LAALCAENAECCNLPGHFVCKCKPGFTGNATVSCTGIIDSIYILIIYYFFYALNKPNINQILKISIKSYKTIFFIRLYAQTFAHLDIDECLNPSCCGRGAICENIPGSHTCHCPLGFEGDPAVECWGKCAFALLDYH